jgi:diguanylate cyclase
LPIDILKIDKSFVNDLLIPIHHKHIIGDIIGLAHNLEIAVIAEGIEKELQLNYLKNLGCDYIQGFLLCKPMDKKALETFLEQPPYNNNFLNRTVTD